MDRIIVVTGGSRSGKSSFARQLAEKQSQQRTFIATAQAGDAEMKERIKKHREARENSQWQTIEEPLDIAGAIRAAENSHVLLVDCLTLWISNLLFAGGDKKEYPTEEEIAKKCTEVLNACNGFSGTVIFVTNEVGMGIVPDNPLSRRFRDLAGRANKIIADHAAVVVFMVSGQPLILKGDKP